MQNIRVIKKIVPLTISVTLLFFTQQASYAESETLQPEENVSKGKDFFIQKGCHVCHGYVGQGWLGGKRIAEPVLPLISFKALVRRPNGSMPPYSPKVLSEDELESIHQYLASLKSPNAQDIPLLQREE